MKTMSRQGFASLPLANADFKITTLHKHIRRDNLFDQYLAK